MSTIDTKYNLKEVLRSILFVAGEGVEKEYLAEKLDITMKELEKAVCALEEECSGDNGLHLIRYKNKIQLSSNPNFADYISDVLSPVREKSLTRAALETLDIIAYKQPVTKLEIEDIRRVNCDYATQALLDQNMIEIVGRKDAVGRPLLFGTTEDFLKRFNISSVEDLPDYSELMERIKVLDEAEQPQSDSLFKNVDDFKFEDELPLPNAEEGEEFFAVSGDEEAE